MRAPLFAAVSALALLCAAPAMGQVSGTTGPGKPADRLETRSKHPYGRYLTDGSGRAVYLFMKDEQGKGASACYDACAQAWPPVLAGRARVETREAAKAPLLGTIERKDGSRQLTYNGWPLYYFVKDRGPGQVSGQDVKGFGAEWYLVAPDGSAVHAEGEKQG